MHKLLDNKIINFIAVLGTVLAAAGAVLAHFCSYISPEYGYVWSLMAFITPVFLFINNITLFVWCYMGRLRMILFPVIAIVANIGYVAAIAQPPSCASAEKGDFRIMTLNSLHFTIDNNSRITAKKIDSILQKRDINILCLQEYDKPKFDAYAKLFAPRMPYQYMEHSVAILSHYPILNSHAEKFADSDNDYAYADLNIDGDTVRLFSVHLQSSHISILLKQFDHITAEEDLPFARILKLYAANTRKRARQVQLIRSIIDTTRYPTIVVGDFNDMPSSYSYRTVKGHDLNDAFRDAGEGFAGSYNTRAGSLRIDYVLYDEHFRATNYQVLRDTLSDHQAVVADLKFR